MGLLLYHKSKINGGIMISLNVKQKLKNRAVVSYLNSEGRVDFKTQLWKGSFVLAKFSYFSTSNPPTIWHYVSILENTANTESENLRARNFVLDPKGKRFVDPRTRHEGNDQKSQINNFVMDLYFIAKCFGCQKEFNDKLLRIFPIVISDMTYPILFEINYDYKPSQDEVDFVTEMGKKARSLFAEKLLEIEIYQARCRLESFDRDIKCYPRKKMNELKRNNFGQDIGR